MVDEIRQSIRETRIGYDGTIMSSTGALIVPVGRITMEGVILFGDKLEMIRVTPEQIIGDLVAASQNSVGKEFGR
ncbi:hypothetical protein HZB97_00315 [Candidatus Gottesmanbacteria bacterium]|nr:hypothetical protein [Candidatus Gottesmanbacteria bacterium]